MRNVTILGTGSFVPPRILSNADLTKMGLETSDEWIYRRTGIKERRVAAPDMAASDLANEAAKRALEMSGLEASDLDLIIVATITPDTCCPSSANWLQSKLNAPQAVTFDITAACSGFIFGLNIAEQYLKTKACQTVMVVASEVMTRTLDWEDRSTAIFWGDGAGSAVLSSHEGPHKLLSTHIHTDGSRGQNLLLPGGGSKTTPISHESVDEKRHFLKMIEASKSFKVAVRYFSESIKEAAEYNNVGIEEIDWFIPHQANFRMFQFIADSMDIPIEKFYLTLHKYGNISSASCAIALDEAIRNGSIQKNHLICLPVFGGGLTWGSGFIRW